MNFNRKNSILMFVFITFFNPVVNAQLLESFDNIKTLQVDGWVFDNRSDFPTKVFWSQGIESIFSAQSGEPTSYIFNTTASGGDLVCNWLIMPDVGLIERLSFYTRSRNMPNEVTRMKVMYSPTGDINTGACTNTPAKINALKGSSDFGSFQTLLTINQSQGVGGYPQEWAQYTVDVNGNGRIAFLYYVDTGAPNFNSGLLAIDTVAINDGTTVLPPPPPQAVPALNVSGLILLLLSIFAIALWNRKEHEQN